MSFSLGSSKGEWPWKTPWFHNCELQNCERIHFYHSVIWSHQVWSNVCGSRRKPIYALSEALCVSLCVLNTLCVLNALGLGFGYRLKVCVSPPTPFMYCDPNPQCGDWTFGRWLGYEGGLLMHGFIHLWDPRKLPCLFCHVGLQREDSHVWIR